MADIDFLKRQYYVSALGLTEAQAARMTINDLEHEFFSTASPTISGIGSPEGVIAAPVSSYYTDTAGTTGAWRWLKKIGTGNTGWVCIDGDTGARNIASLIAGATWSGGTMCRLQRIDSTVFLTLDVVTQTGFTAQSVLILPPGFTDAPTYLTPGYGGVQWYALSGNSVILNTSGANPGFRGMWSWPTGDAWPATLPGTAAV